MKALLRCLVGVWGAGLLMMSLLVSMVRQQPPQQSPFIVFISDRDGQEDVYVMRSNGRNVRRLTADAAYDWYPQWSPDGEWIVFASSVEGNQDIYKIPAVGGERQRLTDDPSVEAYPDWSPDGSKITFVSDQGRQLSGIYIMESTGGGVEPLFLPDWGDIWSPAWSSDASHIYFQARNTGYRTNIYVMSASGEEVNWLLDGRFDAFFPQPSPDGHTLVYNAFDRRSNDDIYVMALPDGEPRQLTFHWAEDRLPMWSADGKELAFMTRHRGNWDVYRMNADGSQQTNLTPHPADDWSPSWSPPLEGLPWHLWVMVGGAIMGLVAAYPVRFFKSAAFT